MAARTDGRFAGDCRSCYRLLDVRRYFFFLLTGAEESPYWLSEAVSKVKRSWRHHHGDWGEGLPRNVSSTDTGKQKADYTNMEHLGPKM
ncbi:hypothetical protein CCACVL1_16365 [Corchorus capsularis]|uniref:Uncharacterized protein n=1 Tax=Corchorus capsularis TaxID=210143 RepID=A0A1R3HXC6_COCAP|nr:hypothetical protein CCACVL1_16365 [Corchorus capsularis]